MAEENKNTNNDGLIATPTNKGVPGLKSPSSNGYSHNFSKSGIPDHTFLETFQKNILVTYNNQKYKVLHQTHSHLQLEGLEKAVPIWECQYLK